jgi:hypothetical protein
MSHFANLKHMAEKAKYEQYRIKAIDSFFSNSLMFMRILKAMGMSYGKAKDLAKIVSDIGDSVDYIKFGVSEGGEEDSDDKDDDSDDKDDGSNDEEG